MKYHSELPASRQDEKDHRLNPRWQPDTDTPVLGDGPIRYEVSERIKAVTCGGLGLIVQLVKHIGLAKAIDDGLHLLKRHKPYHESDHVLNMTYNIVTGGRCLENLEQRRQDVCYLDALDVWRIPDSTTEGDFLRRFEESDVEGLMDLINRVRQKVWKQQSPSMRRLALIDVDGTISPTQGEQKEKADFSYNGKWGYAPLVLTLANTQEVLFIANRPGNRPSHDNAFHWIKKSVDLVRAGDFEKIRLRGDTAFSVTSQFDYWTDSDVEFVFGIDSQPTFVNRAKDLPKSAWSALKRSPEKRGQTPRFKGRNLLEEKVEEREYIHYRLAGESIAEIAYKPRKAKRVYRMIVLRKLINVKKGQQRLEDEIQYRFYVTNVPVRKLSAVDVVFQNNARCHQENIIKEIKHGVHATQMPSKGFVANWAYMVIGTLAWNLKIWLGLMLAPVAEADARELLRMGYRRFVEEVITTPCQIVETSGYHVFRLLSLTRWSRLMLEGGRWLRKRHRIHA